jgi:hypothetical protein
MHQMMNEAVHQGMTRVMRQCIHRAAPRVKMTIGNINPKKELLSVICFISGTNDATLSCANMGATSARVMRVIIGDFRASCSP